jgi:carboxymethylenebutenolidase
VNPSMGAAVAALEKANLVHQVKTYEGVNHAFFNDTGQRYDKNAAEQAYAAVLDWFGKYLA